MFENDSAIRDDASLETESFQRPAPPHVLAVDDEPQVRRLLSTILGQGGYSCTTANSGEEALTILQREPFDAVISDLGMPGIGGMELLAEVRQRFPHLAFLVVTGVDDVEMGVKAMRSGSDDYLLKPLLEGAVLTSLERALRNRELERQVEHYRWHLERMVAERTEQLGTALQHIERSYEDTLRALGAAIDLRDSETAGHSQRVCLFSLEIARAMNLPERELKSLAKGAYLHDIGKLGVSDAILLKPGPLDANERRIMQKHAGIGFELVRGISFLADVAEIILSHHERFDGTGYPRGLRGEQILPGARIFAVADALDAITSDRPYRGASSFAKAREAIRLESGRQFDPHVVQLFLDIPAETWPAIAANQRQTASVPYSLGESGALAQPVLR